MTPEWLGKRSIEGTAEELQELCSALIENVKAGADPTKNSPDKPAIWTGDFGDGPPLKRFNSVMAGRVWETDWQLEHKEPVGAIIKRDI